MKHIFPGYAALILSLLLVPMTAGLVQAPAQPPNLVVITVDTLRADHLECYGYKAIKTPRINALAADGILVENAYTPVPLTLPSHASIFTGTYPVFHGVRDFTGFTLSKERTTLATMLKFAGYRTGAVVASAVLEARWGINQGFDFYYDNFPAVPAAELAGGRRTPGRRGGAGVASLVGDKARRGAARSFFGSISSILTTRTRPPRPTTGSTSAAPTTARSPTRTKTSAASSTTSSGRGCTTTA